ncbi:TetR/AcrR family transcriptional regulator [Prescottella agglutinans]|uniref:AcrR family transcriptional regulator n=1 Tax=Prescottella agglutinans TaxID=1644129 RepID=A0ABT6M920_9NOCA|nr:TetR/AcrR family transcriptional regulator [Prescottella agglutinans]MDH6280409.1 AcrR family transcriptional regulator [Prescottella agglutinans]
MGIAHDRILAVAEKRFYRDGIGATGINTLTDEAGVARMSLYKNFASKDDVIAEYLQQRFDTWRALYDARRTAAETPADIAASVPRSYLDHVEAIGADFRGCGLLNAAAELNGRPELYASILARKDEVMALLRADLAESGVDDPDQLTEIAFLLLEGAVVHDGLHGRVDHLDRVVRHIDVLVAQALADSA